MKSVLLDSTNRVWEVVKPGEEFEVFEGEPTLLHWEDCSEDDVYAGMYKNDDGTYSNPNVDQAFTEEGQYNRFLINRKIAYGEIGEQLDMLYKDMLNNTTNWIDSVTAAKAAVPKVEKPADYVEASYEPILNPSKR